MSLNGAFSLMLGTQRSASSDGSYMSSFGGFFSLGNGKTGNVTYKRALTLMAVYNAVEQISNDIAKIPFSVNQKIDGNRKSQPNHPAHRLISFAPNSLMTTFVFRKTMATSLLLRGNALAKINDDAQGNPISTDFINWDKVQDIRKKDGELLYYIQGYDRPLFASEVLHWKHFTHDGIVGVGPITYGAQQLGLAIEVQEFSATNFANKGVTQGIIHSEKQLNPEAKAKITAGVQTSMAAKSVDRMAVLDEGMKFHPIAITPQEMQIIETAKFTVEDIARMFNIAPHKIKSLAQSTNNNIEQQSLDHVSDTIQPYITNIEQEYAMKLFSAKEIESGYYIRGNINVLLRADIKSRAQWITSMVYCGVMTRNEARKYEDMNDGPEFLNEHLTPTNQFIEAQIEQNLKDQKDGNQSK
jgi:HK97 family phage portal protein